MPVAARAPEVRPVRGDGRRRRRGRRAVRDGGRTPETTGGQGCLRLGRWPRSIGVATPRRDGALRLSVSGELFGTRRLRLDEREIRRAATIHHDAQPESVQHRSGQQQCHRDKPEAFGDSSDHVCHRYYCSRQDSEFRTQNSECRSPQTRSFASSRFCGVIEAYAKRLRRPGWLPRLLARSCVPWFRDADLGVCPGTRVRASRLGADAARGRTGRGTRPLLAPVEGVRLTLVQEETGERRTVASDRLGQFVVPGVPPGTHRLEIEHPGFKRYTQRLRLQVSQELRADVSLELGTLAETVDVIAPAVSAERLRSARITHWWMAVKLSGCLSTAAVSSN